MKKLLLTVLVALQISTAFAQSIGGGIYGVSTIPITSITGLGTGVATLLGGTASGTGGPAGTIAPTFTGTVNQSAVAATDYIFNSVTGSTTAASYGLIQNTSGKLYYGVDTGATSAFFTSGATAYDTIFGYAGGKGMSFGPAGGAVTMRLSSGLMAVNGNITATTVTAALSGNATTATDTASKTGTGSTYATSASPTFTGLPILGSVEDNITAFAGGGQGSATQLSATAKYHRITTAASSNDSVKLPAATAGAEHFVTSTGVASVVAVFPASGETIANAAANASVAFSKNGGMFFICITAGNWQISPVRTIGTTNQIVVTPSSTTGTITLSTPQDINTTSNVTFANITSTATSSTGTAVIQDGSGVFRPLTSSEEFKANIRRNWAVSGKQASAFLSLSPIVFDYKDTEDTLGVKDVLGFSANEADASGLTEMVNYKDGKPYSLREHGVLAYLWSMVKIQQAQIDMLIKKFGAP